MDAFWIDFLNALRRAVHGGTLDWHDQRSNEFWRRFYRVGQEHCVLPMIVNAVWDSSSLASSGDFKRLLGNRARTFTISQAQRTADFKLLYLFLLERGLHPVVLKGIICRNLYPVPDQRASFDEDILIRPEEYLEYHKALLAYGFHLVDPNDDIKNAYEVAYQNDENHLYLEVHKLPFSPDSKAYGDLNELFAGVLDHTVDVRVGDMDILTITPTCHLLYLLCHAYKHFLHSGVGIRQACDIGMFSWKHDEDIDWTWILESCRRYSLGKFSAAVFRINNKYLGFDMPAAFAGIDVDEMPLLCDMLSGGLYGASDMSRLHSSNMTLDAVASHKNGRQALGLLRSVFLPIDSMTGRYPYLNDHRWLLPAAWMQRVWHYLIETMRAQLNRRKNGLGKVPSGPAASVRLGKSRVELLRMYGIIR